MAARTAFQRRSSSAVEMGVFNRSLSSGMSSIDPFLECWRRRVLTARSFLHIVRLDAPQRGARA
jgi:hypothetical protein